MDKKDLLAHWIDKLLRSKYFWYGILIIVISGAATHLTHKTIDATKDEKIHNDIRVAHNIYDYDQDQCLEHRFYPNITSGSFGWINASFIEYYPSEERMLLLFGENKSLSIRVKPDVPFSYLMEKYDNVKFLVYRHPESPEYTIPSDMHDNGTDYTVAQINWTSEKSEKAFNVDMRRSELDLGHYFTMSIILLGALIILSILGVRKTQKIGELLTSFVIAYAAYFLIYLLKTPGFTIYLKMTHEYSLQVQYVAFALLSLFAMLITFQIGVRTRYTIKEEEKPSLQSLVTVISFVSVIVTFIGGLLSPLGTPDWLYIPSRMAIVMFGAMLGLDSFLIGMLNANAPNMSKRIGSLFAMILGSLFAVIALAYTEGYYFSTLSAIATMVIVGTVLSLFKYGPPLERKWIDWI